MRIGTFWFLCLLNVGWLLAPFSIIPRAAAESSAAGRRAGVDARGAPSGKPRLSTAAYQTQAKSGQRVAGVHWTFRDIDVQTLLARLKRFGVELPVPATGRVTVRLSIGAPWRSILRPGAYEVEGDLTSAALTVAGIELRQLSLHLAYKEGALDLTKMRFVVPEKNGAGGTISGNAHMQVRPAGDLNVRLTIDRLPISMLAGAIQDLAGRATGTINGQFNGHAPANRLRDLTAWQADGRLTIANFTAFGVPELQATTNMRLAQGEATLSSLSVQFAGAAITASGRMKLTTPYAFNSRLQVTVPDLGWLNRIAPDFRPPVSVAGNFSLSADATGQLAPKRVRVRGTLQGRELKADNVTIDRLAVPFDGTLDRIRVNNLRIDLYSGRVLANLTLPTDPDGNVGVGLRVDNVDLANAASDLLQQKQSWRGAASGRLQLQAPARRLQDPSAWNGQGELNFGRGNVFGIDVSRIATRLEVAAGRLTVRDLSLESAIARVTGSVNANLVTPFGFGAALRIAEVDFAQLNRLPEELHPPVAVAGRAGISLRAQGTLQPMQFTARGGVATRRLRAEGVVIDSLNFNYQLSQQALSLSQIAGALYGGGFNGSATLPLSENGHSQLDVTWRQIDVGRLLGAVDVDPWRGVRSQGSASGRITAQADGNPRELANWQATTNVNLEGMRVEQAAIGRLAIDASLARQVLTVSRITSEGGSIQLNGTATLGLTLPYEVAVKMSVANADLSLANGLPARLRPPVTVGGRVSLSADLKGQLDPLQMTGNGDFRARNVRLDSARFDSLGFTFVANNDVVDISQLAVVAYRGRVDGGIKVPLAEDAEGAIDMRWQRVNIGGMLTDLRGLATKSMEAKDSPTPLIDALNQARFEGWTWGSISVHTPAGKLLDPATWDGSVDLSLAAVRLFGWSAKQGFLRARIADGRAELSRLALDLDGSRLRGTGRLNLAEPYDFDSSFSLEDLQLAEFNELPEPIRPPLKVSGTVNVSMAAQGTLKPLEVTGKGSITGDALEAGRARVDHLAIEFGAQKDRLTLNRFEADLYGGRIDGNAEIPLQGEDAGHVDFNWQEINLGQFVTDVARLPVTLRGTLAGKLHVGMPAGKLSEILVWDVDASFDTSPLVTQSQRLGELHGRLTYGGRQVDYRLNGELLRGAIELAGRWQPTPQANAVNEGHFQWSSAHLDALTPLLGAQSTLGSLTGLVTINVRYRHDEQTGAPTGTGDLQVDDVRLNGETLLDELQGVIRLTADRLEMTNAEARLAGGSLTASGYAFLDPRRRGMFRLTIGNADVAQLLAPWPRSGSQIRGVIDAQLEGFFGGGRPVVVTGTVAMSRGRARGIEFDSVRVPVHGTIDPASGRGSFELHGLTGQIAHGRLTGDFDVTLASGLGLSGRGKFARVDLRTLLQESGSTSRLASGRITGNYTLAGRNVRTPNDLTGTLDATLHDTQAMSLPIFERALPYLTGGVSGSTTFDEGTVRGSLARGVIRVDRFSLSSGSAQIFAQGNVTLAGRLDLNVTVNTGQLNVPRRTLSLLASRILLVAAPPIGLLVNVTQFLSNQVINLEVTGTVRSPTIRIRPLNLLGQEAAQFFLLQALP